MADLFILRIFARNLSITGCTKVALRYFGPFPVKRRREMLSTLVFFSENLILQNASGAKDQQIEIRRIW